MSVHRRARVTRLLAAATACALVGACKSEAVRKGHELQMPNAVSGGTPGGGRPRSPSLEQMKADDAYAAEIRAKKAADEAAALKAKADGLWASGLAKEGRNLDDAADDFGKLANDFPDHPMAGEARFREAKYRAALG